MSAQAWWLLRACRLFWELASCCNSWRAFSNRTESGSIQIKFSISDEICWQFIFAWELEHRRKEKQSPIDINSFIVKAFGDLRGIKILFPSWPLMRVPDKGLMFFAMARAGKLDERSCFVNSISSRMIIRRVTRVKCFYLGARRVDWCGWKSRCFGVTLGNRL